MKQQDQIDLLEKIRYFAKEKRIFPHNGTLEYKFIQEVIKGNNPWLNQQLIRTPVFIDEIRHGNSLYFLDYLVRQEIVENEKTLSEIIEILEYFADRKFFWKRGFSLWLKRSAIPTMIADYLQNHRGESLLSFLSSVIYKYQVFDLSIWGQCTFNQREYEGKDCLVLENYTQEEILQLFKGQDRDRDLESFLHTFLFKTIITETAYQMKLYKQRGETTHAYAAR